MSVIKDDVGLTVTFEDDSWKTAYPGLYTVTDGTNTFTSASTWLYKEKNTLKSAAITNNGTAEITITASFFVPGTISFNYIVSSEASCDILHVLIDDTEVVKVSGTDVTAFRVYSQSVDAGSHTIIFRYTKDRSTSKGNDACAIGYLKMEGVIDPFEIRYLMQDFNGKVYTITDDTVTEVTELEGTVLNKKEQFQTYGFTEKPSSDEITSLTKPVVYRWSEKTMNPLKSDVSAVPKSQTIFAAADMSHETIQGITDITSVYQGTVNVSYSYDNENWTDAMTMADFLNTDLSALYDGAVNKKIYFRFVIEGSNSSLTNFVITYKNE